ncbi:MAG: hypothetical protein NC344_01380 [Bacteroidales bacterium]|nr:hypothetical protein [Bacteroidales bacterium]MCM1146489.1 hypothetical protein [Bacteroidales bacterium]MCM1205073.1 hypothetical protein [Bacillota bacterium]MCM1509319.1 hypothetical protein [Clostridium sp.]
MKKTLISFIATVMTVMNAMAESSEVVLRSAVTKPQPMTGLVLWPEQAEDLKDTHGQSIQLEFAYCLPCKVVTGCADDGTIQYDWTWFDNILDDVSSRGHQLIARFRYEYPDSKDVDGKTAGMTAVPQYIKDRSDYSETYNKVKGDGPTYYADWSNEELKRFTKQFYSDFAARYSSDPRLAFLEVGFGHWSEYHIFGTALQLGKNFPSKEYQKEFFIHMEKTMTSIPWGISIDATDSSLSPVTEDAALMTIPFGCFDDSFMHKDHETGTNDGYNEECWNAIGSETRWQKGFAGGEISYYTDNDQKNFLNPAGMYGHTWEEQASKYHVTFMIANDAPEGVYGTGERFKSAAFATGYHFVVKRCTTDGTVTNILVTNTGVAPIYRDAYFAIDGNRSGTSLRGLLPGEEKWITVPCGTELNVDGTPMNMPEIECDYILKSQEIQYDAGPVLSNDASATFLIDGNPITVDNSYMMNVPYDVVETQYVITVIPAENAKIKEYTGVTISGNSYIVKTPAQGSMVTAAFTIEAEDGVTMRTYTINIKRDLPPSSIPSEEICHFTGNTPSMPDIVSVKGNYAKKGTVTYAGVTYDVCVKMESSTSVAISPVYDCTVTLYFTSGSGKSYLNGTSFSPDAESKYSFHALAGETYSLTKNNTNTNLVIIVFSADTASGLEHVWKGMGDAGVRMYDISGRRTVSPADGQLIIKNGKKTIYRSVEQQ